MDYEKKNEIDTDTLYFYGFFSLDVHKMFQKESMIEFTLFQNSKIKQKNETKTFSHLKILYSRIKSDKTKNGPNSFYCVS